MPGTRVPAGVLLRRDLDSDLVLLAVADEMIDRAPRSRCSRRGGARRSSRSPTPRRRGTHPRTPRTSACRGPPPGPRSSSGTPTSRPGSTRCPDPPTGYASEPIITSWGNSTGFHDGIRPPRSRNALTFGRTLQPSLNDVRLTEACPSVWTSTKIRSSSTALSAVHGVSAGAVDDGAALDHEIMHARLHSK